MRPERDGGKARHEPSGYASARDGVPLNLLFSLLAACTSSGDDTAAVLDCGNGAPPPTWYADLDGDGYGRSTATRALCEAPYNYVDNADDCDDARAGVYPGAAELCDGLDGDCDGMADGEDPDMAIVPWYPDADGDGYGDDAGAVQGCAAPDDSYVAEGGDCDDDDPDAWPDAPDECGGADADCDGRDDPCERVGEATLDSADAVIDGATGGDAAGTAVADAGDVDGDGYADVLLTAPHAGDGEAYLVRGPLSGASSVATADATFSASGASFGTVAALGDRDADGIPELVLGAPDLGIVYLFSGAARGDVAVGTAALTLVGDGGDDAGTALVDAGDVTGDGVHDLLVGAPGAESGSGAVYVVPAGAAGSGDLTTFTRIVGTADDHAGYAVDGAGDVDGDGIADVIVGAWTHNAVAYQAGAAYLVLGPVTEAVSLADADATLLGTAEGDEAGAAVTGAGDIDGDGTDDLMVGGPGVSEGVGAAWLVRGPVSGEVSLADAWCTLTGEDEGQRAGSTLVGVGDVSADGRADVLVGSDEAAAEGRAWLLQGPFAGTISLTYAEASFTGAAALDQAGASIGGGSDIDGDGIGDLLIGAPGADGGGSSAGAVYVIRGWGR